MQEAVLAPAEIRDAAVNCRSSNSVRRQHNPYVVVGALECLSRFRPRVDTGLVNVAKWTSSLDKLRKLDYELVFVGLPVGCFCVLVGVVGVAVLNVVLPVELPECAWMQVNIQSLPNDVNPPL
jgi:hypothetical protein